MVCQAKGVQLMLSDYEYYRTDNGVLYCGNNKKIMAIMEHEFDLCLTDPPYGINADSNPIKGVFRYGKTNWDASRPDKLVFDYFTCFLLSFVIL